MLHVNYYKMIDADRNKSFPNKQKMSSFQIDND